MKLIFFGTGNYTISVIDSLKKEFDVTVFTTEKEESRPLVRYCSDQKIKCISASSVTSKEIKNEIKKIGAQIALVASFRWLIPEGILNLFPKGVLNIHPSLLPKYRGATPAQSAILDGEKVTGVSIIKLDKDMDHGPILWQKKENILPDDTAKTLYLRLFNIASEEINNVINKYLKGEIIPISQNESDATYVKKFNRENVQIDYKTNISKDILERMIRAYYPWPGVWTEIELNGKLSRVKFLPGNKIQVEGKNPVSYKDFINGYPKIDKKFILLLKQLEQ